MSGKKLNNTDENTLRVLPWDKHSAGLWALALTYDLGGYGARAARFERGAQPRLGRAAGIGEKGLTRGQT